MREGVCAPMWTALVATNGLTGVGIDLEARKIAAGDVDAQAVAGAEPIGRRRQSDGYGVDAPGFQQLGIGPRFAIAHAQHGVGEVEREALGIVCAGRVDVDQFGGEVRVECRRRDPQFDRDLAGDFEILGQRLGLEYQHVRALRQLAPGGAIIAKPVALALVDGPPRYDLAALAALVRPGWVDLATLIDLTSMGLPTNAPTLSLSTLPASNDLASI